LRRSQSVKSGMWANEIVEKEKNRNEIIGRIERRKPLFGFVPCFKLSVKAFDQVGGDVVVKAPDADMLDSQYGLNRNFISTVTASDDGSGFTEMFDGIQ